MFKKKYRLICITDNLQKHDIFMHKTYVIQYKSWCGIYWFTHRTFNACQPEYAEKYFKLLITNKLKEIEVIC